MAVRKAVVSGQVMTSASGVWLQTTCAPSWPSRVTLLTGVARWGYAEPREVMRSSVPEAGTVRQVA